MSAQGVAQKVLRPFRPAPASHQPNPMDRVLGTQDGPYVAIDRGGSWDVTWFGTRPLTFDTEAGALAALKRLADDWRESKAPTVYFIGEECRIGALVKIGVSTSPRRRLATLQTASGRPLAILASSAGNRDDEQRLHRRFSRSRREGEWFTITPALKRVIDERA